MPELFIFGVIALIVLGVIWSFYAQKKRREEMSALARELGWRFAPERDTYHDDEYAHFEVFRKGHSRAAFNTLFGELTIDGRSFPAKAGDFRYRVTSGSGKNRSTRTYRFTYLIVHLPFDTPELVIRREGFFDKVSAAFGFDDIDFESAEFSRRFHVSSSDKRFAYDVIHPRMMEFLLKAEPPMIDIEHGRCCLASGGRSTWSPAELKWCIDFVGNFFDRWPDHLTRQLES